jgi:hypothetical protein
MKSRFTLVALLALGLGFTACEDAFNEKDAIEAQKELLTMKYQNEMELEKLRQTAATALKQLEYTNLIAQLKLEDSLTRAGEVAAKRQTYSFRVLDMDKSTPIEGASVSVASEGQIQTASTDASGFVTFADLVLYDGSLFQITKEGYAATKINKAAISSTLPVFLWNTAEATNEVKGQLFVETDLTNSVAEVAPANVLVTANVWFESTYNDWGYIVEFPGRTDASGKYSIDLPNSPDGSYWLSFHPITANQKLYISGSEDAGNSAKSFPNVLPSIATVNTDFSAYDPYELNDDYNRPYWYSGIAQPSMTYYLQFAADAAGVVAYANTGVSTSQMTDGSGNYEISGLSVSEVLTPGNAQLKYAKNATISVSLVDWTGKYVKDAPILVAYTDENGNLRAVNNSFVDFKRNVDNTIASGAKGVLVKRLSTAPNEGYFNYWENLINTSSTSDRFRVEGEQVIVKNFTYGVGYNREKVVY